MTITRSTVRTAAAPPSRSGVGRRSGVLLVTFVVLSLIGASAWAYWSTTGNGTGSATTSTLNAPTGVNATAASGSSTVNVSWTAPSGGSAPQGYYVTRTSGGTTAPACGTAPDNLTHGTSCAEASVPDGTYTYKVTAVLNSWSATSSPSSGVTVVSVIATTTTVSSDHDPSVVGQTVTYTATVAARAGTSTPTGSVTFKDDGITICTGPQTLDGSGRTTCRVPYLGVGSHPITAVYVGSGNFGSSNSTVFNQTVNQANTSTWLTSSSSPSVTGQTVTYTATVAAVSPGSGTPSGTVTFQDNSNAINCAGGSQTLAAGQATCQVSYNAVNGNHTSITAVYAGDTDFSTSTSASISQAVNKASTTTSLGSSSNPSVTGQSVTYTAMVSVTSPGSGPATGAVTFNDGANPIACSGGTQTLNASGVATCQVSYTAAGSHSITANYPGDNNYATSSSASLSQTVRAASTTTALSSSSSPSVTGQSVTYTATVTAVGPGSGTPTGTVTFTDSTTTPASTICSAVALSSGKATCTISYPTVGVRSIRADYGSDPNYASSFGSLSQTVSAASTTTALSSSASPSVTGQSVTYTATVAAVSPGSGTPTGTVTFTDSTTTPATTICSAATLSSGKATCTIAYATVGVRSIRADYSSDPNYASSFGSLSQTVSAATTTTALSSSASPSVTGQSVTYTATVAAVSPGSGTPTGTVTFTDSTTTPTTICSAAPLSSGKATCTISYATLGTHAISASYTGDSNYGSSSTTAPLSQRVVNAAVTGLGFANVQVGGKPVTPSCTGKGTVTFACTISGQGNNAVLSASATFVDSNGNATVYASDDQSLAWSATGKGVPNSGNLVVSGGTSTSVATASATMNGKNSATLTINYTAGGVNWTATITVSN